MKAVVTEMMTNGVRVSVDGLIGEIFYYHLKERVLSWEIH